jgi:membrane protease YdiL (CAAX protease family)
MRNLMKQVGAVIWSGFLAFVIVLVGQGVWGTLAFTNLRTTPAIPCPVMALLLWLLWRHLGGQGWPRRTAATRQRLLRAKRVRAPVFAWALVAGVLIVALAGYWVVMFNLVKMPGNLVPDVSKYPPLTVALMLAMAILAAPFSEEPAFRGYCLGILERNFSNSGLL